MTTKKRDDMFVRVRDFSYWYPGQKDPILRNINLDLQKGEFVLIIGESGCGKSTLALCFNSIIPATMGGKVKGSFIVGGRDIFEEQPSSMSDIVTMVLQDPESQIANLYVQDEIAFGPQNMLVDRKEIITKVSKAAKFVGLENFQDRSVFGLSGGEKQRIAIASGLVMEPELIIFDEPTANLDPLGTDEVMTLIGELKQGGDKNIIVIEHKYDKIIKWVDRIIVMNNGEIILDGPPKEVLIKFGDQLTTKYRLWVPQITQIALGLNNMGYEMDVPLVLNGNIVKQFSENVAGPFQYSDRLSKGKKPEKKEILISCRDVSFSYGEKTLALNNVNMELSRGSILALMGHNGSGKSTLSTLFVGLNRPTSGQIEICGLDAKNTSIRELAKRVGYVFQYPEHQFVTDKVFDEVAFGLKNVGDFSEKEIEEKVQRVLALFGLQGFLDYHPFKLSLGQKRRLSIATMLVLDPEVLILDEPTSGQDRGNVENLLKLLKEKRDPILTAILITHDVNLVARFATEVLVLENGSVAFSGSPNQLFNQIEDSGEPISILSPDTYKFAKELNNVGVDIPQSFYPEEFLKLIPS